MSARDEEEELGVADKELGLEWWRALTAELNEFKTRDGLEVYEALVVVTVVVSVSIS